MNLSPLPIQKFFGNNGRPLAGGLLFTYDAGTSTKVATYTDASGSVQNTNPIVLDFRGECRLWLDPKQSYKFVLSPPGDTDPPTHPIWTVDDITVAPQAFDNAADDIGSVNNISLIIPQISSPVAFTRVVFKAAHTNTGPTTIQINGGTAHDLTWQTPDAFSGGEIRQNGVYVAIFDGARWQLQGALSQSIIGNLLYPQTDAEIAAGVTPTNYFYPPGDARRYGAVFDDSTDDTAAIQRAFDSGHDVLLPEGTAVISDTLYVRVPGVTIAGHGKHRTVLRQTASDKHGIRVSDSDGSVTNSHKVTIRDLQIKDIVQTGSAEFRGIYVPGADDVTIESCKVLNTGDSGISIGFISDGNDPSLTRSENCRVINCDVENATGPGSDGIGIELIGAIDVLVQGCTIKNTKRYGIRCVACTRPTIIGNRISDFAQMSGDAGINISAGTIPGPAQTECIDAIVANNHIRLDTSRGSGTYMGIQILGAKRWIVSGNRITMSDTDSASTDFRGIDIQNGLSGVENDGGIISANSINGTDLNVGILISHVCNNLKIFGNTIEGFVTHGIRSTATDLTGECFGNSLIKGNNAASGFTKSASASGNFVVWGNTTDTLNNLPFSSNSEAMFGALGRYTRVVARSGNNLTISDHLPHPIETGDRVRFESTGTLPAPLAEATDYYAIRVDDASFQVAISMSGAIAGTEIALTDAGSGTHSVQVQRTIWANAVRP